MSFNNTKTPVKPKDSKKQKYIVPQRISEKGFMELYIPDKMKEQFILDCTNEMNRTVMEWYGLSYSTLQRFMRNFGVEKDMIKVRHKLAVLVKRKCEKNGYYDSIRGKAPSEKCINATRKMRSEGFSPIIALKEKNPRKYKAYLRKISKLRKDLIDKERRRYTIGLMPISDIPSNWYYHERYTRSETCTRSNALKRGYIVGSSDPERGERNMIFFNEQTTRSERFEKLAKNRGFEFHNISMRVK